MQRFDNRTRLKGVAFAPSGAVAATGGQDGIARLWDVRTGRLLHMLDGHSDILDVRFSRDGTRLATTALDGSARVWDAGSGVLVSTISGHTGFVASVEFTRDGSRLITTSRDGTIRISDPGTGHELLVLRGHRDVVDSATVDPSGRALMSVGADKTIRIWDALPEPELRPLVRMTGPVTSVAAAGDLIAASAGTEVLVVDARDGRVVHRLLAAGPLSGLGFSPDGALLAAAGRGRAHGLARRIVGASRQLERFVARRGPHTRRAHRDRGPRGHRPADDGGEARALVPGWRDGRRGRQGRAAARDGFSGERHA